MKQQWYAAVPKVELHVHLEGAIPLEALWQLVAKYGGDPAAPDLEALRGRFVYRDFGHFIETWCWKNRFLRQDEDFTFIAEAVAKDLLRQNIRYAEVFYSPSSFLLNGMTAQSVTAAVRKGFDRVSGIRISLIADLVRDHEVARELRVLEELREVQSLGLIGIGIGGSEQKYPPGPFAGLFESARRWGFHTNAHAGEVAGPESIWSACRDLQAERIGHATAAFLDDALLEHLRARQIPLDLCPGSNLRTGAVGSLKEHPVRQYVERGLLCTINTDDPAMFGTSLEEEYRSLHDDLGFSGEQLRALIINGIAASWLSPADKEKLAAEFRHDAAWQAHAPD